LGGTVATGIHITTYVRLKKALGLPLGTVKIEDPMQMLAEVQEEVRRALSTDVVKISLPTTVFGFKNEHWKPFTLPDGTEALVPGQFNTEPLTNGDLLQYPQGDRRVLPSGRMPENGYYFDFITRQEPFEENELDPKKWVEETFGLLDDEVLRFLEDRSKWFYENTDYFIMGEFAAAAFGSIISIQSPHVRHPSGIRDIEEFWISYVSRPDHIREIFGYQCEIQLTNLELLRQAVGDRIGAIMLSGTDFGSQDGLIVSPQVYRKMFKPLHRKINDWVHANTTWKTFYHSCGSIVALLDDFWEAGVDILNPIQLSATGMDPEYLKSNYGDKFVFWGGGVDTQHTLPFGEEGEVKAEVDFNKRVFGKGGGFVLGPVHNIQANVPVENVLALYAQ
jgi:hypothetical protein